MAEEQTDGKDRVSEIEDQIQETLHELEQIRIRKMNITDPAGMEAAERKIVKATDKLASLLTGLKIQQSLDSDELKEQEKKLIESLPERYVNQGRRRVEIQMSRGEPVILEASYYSKNKKKKKQQRKRKKKR